MLELHYAQARAARKSFGDIIKSLAATPEDQPTFVSKKVRFFWGCCDSGETCLSAVSCQNAWDYELWASRSSPCMMGIDYLKSPLCALVAGLLLNSSCKCC